MNPYQQNYYPPQQIVPQQESSGLLASTKIFFTIAIPLLWFIALWIPAYSNGTKGGVCLLFGWSMLFTGNGWAFLAWLSNFPFWIGFFMFAFSKRKKSHVVVIVLTAIALLFSVGALTVTKIESDITSGMEHVESCIGAWVWMFSIGMLLVGSIISVTSTAPLPMPSFAQQFNPPPANYYQNYPPQYSQPYYPPQNYQQHYSPQQQYQQPIPPQQIPPAQIPQAPIQTQENPTNYQPPQNPPPPTDDTFPSEIPTTYVPPTDDPFAPPKE